MQHLWQDILLFLATIKEVQIGKKTDRVLQALPLLSVCGCCTQVHNSQALHYDAPSTILLIVTPPPQKKPLTPN